MGSARMLVSASTRVGGVVSVPGDKSISHRALMLGAVAEGTTTVRGFLEGEDCLATRSALEALGVAIEQHDYGALTIEGCGLHGLSRPSGPLDLGNSGTAIRLLTGLLAAQPFDTTLTGDDSLRKRPMRRVTDRLTAMGAQIETTDGRAPIHIHAGATLHGFDHELDVASAQVKSALLLAGLSAVGRTSVRSPGPTRDHTERMLASMGVEVTEEPTLHRVAIAGPAVLRGGPIEVPGDFSSAAFFIVAGCLAAEPELVIEGVGVNPTRTGMLTILEKMGARIERRNPRMMGAEPVADLVVRKTLLHGIDVPADLVPLAIDEFPILFVAAAGATGRTRVAGAEELRYKESDRISVMADALVAVGAGAEETADGIVIDGGALDGGTVDSHGDHRVAMALAIASLLSRRPIEILNTAQVATSFPGFAATAAHAGIEIDVPSIGAA